MCVVQITDCVLSFIIIAKKCFNEMMQSEVNVMLNVYKSIGQLNVYDKEKTSY